MTNPTYVPVLKWKAGEQKALEMLASHVRNQVLPLFEIQPVDSEDIPDMQEEFRTFQTKLSRCWPIDNPFLLDAGYIDSQTLTTGVHPIQWFYNQSLIAQKSMIPVTGLSRSNSYQTAVRTILGYPDNLGCAIRIEDEDFLNVSTAIPGLIQSLGTTPQRTDLIIDLDMVDSDRITASAIAVISVLNSIPNIRTYRTVTVCAATFPRYLSSIVTANSITRIDRVGWRLWSLLQRQQLPRQIVFGDYCLGNPDPLETDTQQMRPSATIRYTSSDSFHIFRGRQLRYGFDQYYTLAAQIVSSPIFSGAGFSWGDTQIEQKSRQQGGTGNALTWVGISTNHHITFVTNQLSSPPSFSSTP